MSRDKAVRLHAQAAQYMSLANQCWAQGERMNSVRYASHALIKEEDALKRVLRAKRVTYAPEVVCEMLRNIVVLELKLARLDRARLFVDRAMKWPKKDATVAAEIEELERLIMQFSIAMKGGGDGVIVGDDSVSVQTPVANGSEVGAGGQEADDRVDYAG